jgi:hypothetical protein
MKSITPPTLNLADRAVVRNELIGSDQAVRDDFVRHLGPELDKLAAALALAFKEVDPLIAAVGHLGTERAKLVASFAVGVLDDIVVATKLLLAGKLSAAGNLMRQAIEGVAMATLCVADRPLTIVKKRSGRSIVGLYWKKLDEGHQDTGAHRALDQLAWNASAIGVEVEAVAQLCTARKHYNAYSHPGPTAVAFRTPWSGAGRPLIGGHFDAQKLDFSREEMTVRTALSESLPTIFEHLLVNLVPPTPAPA